MLNPLSQAQIEAITLWHLVQHSLSSFCKIQAHYPRLADALQAGQPVLVDATFIRRERRAPFIALAESLGVPWRVLAFDAPESVLRERVRRRQAAGGDASEAGEGGLASQLKNREPLAPHEAAHALLIDTQMAVDWTAWSTALPKG